MAVRGMTPTQRTLLELRRRGYRTAIVEKYNSFAGCRQDLFSIGDILAIKEKEILLVQATSGSGHSARIRKLTETEHVSSWQWLKAGGKLAVWSWRKLKVHRGGKAVRWEPRIREVRLEDLKGDETVFSRHLLGDHSEKGDGE